ncbi:MAG: class II D-tagatose-bisphosphate aldolase, non-catalytic subunit [Fidelibacterota bacterium]|nr:MAG: class II D-tagatose-bisphosphate aldolase, non-catalytic subunit [Candidatus Neomarinimicrobiota bacterium]
MDLFPLQIVAAHKQGRSVGMYSVCSANRYAIEAALLQAKADGTCALIEATSNQVNQYGGYTGKTPAQFVTYVRDIAAAFDLSSNRLLLGGDHLGPNPWRQQKAEVAMTKARDLIRACVSAGFTKIHLDCSMHLGDDPGSASTPPDPAIMAKRAADLCRVAEEAYAEQPKDSLPLLYVIGTDVPAPGGTRREPDALSVTSVEEARQTIELSKQTFLKEGLESAWERVIGLVVQPGVEFSNTTVTNYDRERAKDLSHFIESDQQLVYEAHSTDYQTTTALRQMVEDHFAILKVGPWLTFTLREAVFALAAMEIEWLAGKKGIVLSNIRAVLDEVMVAHREHWHMYYQGDETQLQYARRYSYSDRLRYYWPRREVTEALDRLVHNLMEHPAPPALLSQLMPIQYRMVRAGELVNSPVELIRHKIMEVTGAYARACQPD